MNNPLINILVRTSNRPKFFANCYKSIKEQDYQNILLIVSYDDLPTKEYVEKYPIDVLVEFKRIEDWSVIAKETFIPGYIEKPFPPNEYFNKMMEYTEPGYIIKLDDDNRFSSPDSLCRIVSKISNERQMLLWRVQFPGYVVPDNQHFGRPPRCCQIDTAGFAFHTNYIKYALWDGSNYSDFRTALSLFLRIPQKVYINEILTALQYAPGSGLRKDCPN